MKRSSRSLASLLGYVGLLVLGVGRLPGPVVVGYRAGEYLRDRGVAAPKVQA